jgi:predicted MFS family arabinose efflux permease
LAQSQTARAEWRAHWPLVLAAATGFSFNSLFSYPLGVFMEPMTKDLGWTRSQFTSGLLIPAMIAVPMSPLVGAAIDRWGTRRFAVPGLAIGTLILASFGLASGSMAQWLLLWVLVATLGLMIKSTVWTLAVAGVFTAGRGLALGAVVCGTALSQIFSPPLSEWLIRIFGWRVAFFVLAFGWGGVAFVLALLFLFDAHDRDRRAARSAATAAEAPPPLTGLTFREALRSPAICKIAIVTVIALLLIGAMLVHQVPVLTAAGMSRPRAAMIAGFSGVAALVGKLIAGWLCDRWNARYLGAITLAAPALAFAFLLHPFGHEALIIAAMLILGYVAGVQVQICAYLTSRYGGMRAFGKIFGVMSSLFAIGTGVGPALASAVFDRSGSYAPLFIAGTPLVLVAAALTLSLGPYPDWTAEPAANRNAAAP